MDFLKNRYLWLLFAYIIYSFVGVMSKSAALSGFGMKMFVFLGLQIFLLGLYAIIWQQVLKKFDIVTAMAFKGTTMIFGLTWAVLFFGENVTVYNIIGALVIIVGIYLVSTGSVSSERREDE